MLFEDVKGTHGSATWDLKMMVMPVVWGLDCDQELSYGYEDDGNASGFRRLLPKISYQFSSFVICGPDDTELGY